MKSALELIPKKIEGLIIANSKNLEEAWANRGGEDVLSISFPVKIGFEKKTGKPFCEIGISFIVLRAEDSIRWNWDDKQISLLKPIRDIYPKGNGESVGR